MKQRLPTPREPRRAELRLVVVVRGAIRQINAALLSALEVRTDADAAVDVERRLEQAAFGVREEVGRVRASALSRVREVGDDVSQHASREVGRILGVAVPETAMSAAYVDGFVDRVLGYIGTVAEDEVASIREQLARAAREGWRPERLAEAILQRAEIAEARALRIARNELGSLHADLTRQRQIDAGVEEYVWVTSRDERVRDSHRALHGTKHRWDDPPVVDGERAHPGKPINCRCTASPVIAGVDLRGARMEERRRRAAEAEATRGVRRALPGTVEISGQRLGVELGVLPPRGAAPRRARAGLARHLQLSPDGARVQLRPEGPLRVEPLRRGALGQREGQAITVSPATARRVSSAARALRAGARFEDLASADLDALLTLAHEEAHGASRLVLRTAYRGAGLVVEEVVVETAARILVDPTRRTLPLVGGPVFSDPQRWAQRVVEIFAELTGIGSQLAIDRVEEASLRMLRSSRALPTPRAAVEEFARLLGVRDVDTFERRLLALAPRRPPTK